MHAGRGTNTDTNTLIMAMALLTAGLLAATLVSGCGRRPAGDGPARSAAPLTAGDSGVTFLPPIGAPAGAAGTGASGTFDDTLLPYLAVEVCALAQGACTGASIVRFTAAAATGAVGNGGSALKLDQGAGHYHVNWHTKGAGLNAGTDYRIRVLVAGTALGHVDLDVVDKGSELKTVDATRFVPLLNGTTLPIKLQIAKGAVEVVGAAGGTLTAAGGKVTLAIPAGALTAATGITVRARTSYPAGLPLVAGTVYELGPDGLTFLKPVTLELQYDPAGLPAGVQEAGLSLLKDWQDVVWYTPQAAAADPSRRVVSATIKGFCAVGVSTGPSAITRTQLDWLQDEVMISPLTLSRQVRRAAGYWAVAAGLYNSGAVKTAADFACDRSCRPHLDLFGSTAATLTSAALGKLAAQTKLLQAWGDLEPYVDTITGMTDLDAAIDTRITDQDALQILENVAQVVGATLTVIGAVGQAAGTPAVVTFAGCTVSASTLAGLIAGYFVAKDLIQIASLSMACAAWKKQTCTCGDGVRQGPASSSGFSLTGTEGAEAGADTSGQEECDGQDLGGASCKGLGFSAGTLACKVTTKQTPLLHYGTCVFDLTGCSSGGVVFSNPTVNGRNIEWGAGGGYHPGTADAFCALQGYSGAQSFHTCGGACQFTQCEAWYHGYWTDGNCDGISYDVFTEIVCK